MKGVNLLAASAAVGVSSSTAVPNGAILVPLVRNEDQSAYHADVQVGTPPQSVWLKIDTGSPTYSFTASNNEVCSRPSHPCEKLGTFDNTTSSTSFYEGTGFNNALNNHGQGDYLNDTVAIGGVSSEHMYFGYITRYGFPDRVLDPVYSVLGMSLDCFESPQCNRKGPYLLPQLKQAGKIDGMVSSFYLGPEPEMILGGFYDEAKIDGELLTLDMVNPYSGAVSYQSNNVNVTGLAVIVNGTESATGTYGATSDGVPVLMDTGVATWPVPAPIANAIFAGLGGLLDGDFNPASQWQNIDCNAVDADGHVIVRFGNAGEVEVPLKSLVTRFSDDHCVTSVAARADEPFIFGEPFLRGLYSVFDQENFTISFAKVKHTAEQKIVPLP